MIFNRHSELTDLHAFLGASKYHWINYDDEKLASAYASYQNVRRGTVLHEFASQCIRLKQKLPKSKKTLNRFVNDAISYNMSSEQPLYYSPNCFGTADAISFNNGHLRIHDLKTGITVAHMEQLEIYAALFCLEYGVDPFTINMELRIYQNDDIVAIKPAPEDISAIEEKIMRFDQIIEGLRSKEG